MTTTNTALMTFRHIMKSIPVSASFVSVSGSCFATNINLRPARNAAPPPARSDRPIEEEDGRSMSEEEEEEGMDVDDDEEEEEEEDEDDDVDALMGIDDDDLEDEAEGVFSITSFFEVMDDGDDNDDDDVDACVMGKCVILVLCLFDEVMRDGDPTCRYKKRRREK